MSRGTEKSVSSSASAESDTRDSVASLLEAARSGDQSAHDKIYSKFAGLIETAILTFKGRIPAHIDEESLRSDGADALLNTISNCPKEKFQIFKPYAFKAIKNAFSSTIRGDRGGRAGTRDQWERASEFLQTQISLANEFGRKPTDEEVYTRLGWSKAVRHHHATNPTGRPLQIGVESDVAREYLDELKSPTQGRVETTETGVLRCAIEQLHEEEQCIIQRRYLMEVPLTRRECAKEMGITVGQLDRKTKSALSKLKNSITD